MSRLPADPDGMNEDRAAWADAAIQAFRRECRTDIEDALGDLLCDLRHWADRNGQDFEAMLTRSEMHYEAETRETPTTGDIFSAELAKTITEANQ